MLFSVSIIVMKETTNYENTKFTSPDKTLQTRTFDQEQIDSRINRLFLFFFFFLMENRAARK